MTHSFPTRRSSDLLDDQLNIAETQAITDHRVRQMCSQQLRNGLVVIRLRQRQAIALAQGSDRGVAIDGEVAEVTSRQRLRRQLQRFEDRSEEHTSELQSLMRISYAVFCLKK